MKRLNNIIKSIAVVFGFVAFFAACTENSDPMAENILDVNASVTAFDKTIASPGDQVTVTGANLDKVYKIMLNDNVAVVPFQATANSLIFTIPTSAPLGDVVIVNFLFSGKGLAQRNIEIMSPPTILGFAPVAALGGEMLTVFGAELYKASKVFVGDTEVEFVLIDDKQIDIKALPSIVDGVKLKIVDESGGETFSDAGIIRGTEILITDFDNSPFFTSLSSNGNLDGDVMETGDVPYKSFYTFTITNNNTSWGGNLDFYFTGISDQINDNSKVYLYIDIKVSDELDGRIMVEGPAAVYGDNASFKTTWTTHKLKLSELYTGYGNGDEVGATPIMANLKGVKIQPPAQASSGNFGKTISVDNIKFIVLE
jgi:hypothetical protein